MRKPVLFRHSAAALLALSCGLGASAPAWAAPTADSVAASPAPAVSPAPLRENQAPVMETQPPDLGNALDLRSTVGLARDNSLSAMSSRQQLEATKADRAATLGNALPTVSFQAAPTYSVLPGGGLSSLFGSSGSGMVGFPSNGAYVDSTLQGSWVLFDAFATRDAIHIADLQVKIGQLGAIQAEQDAMTNAAVGYFDVLRAQGLADVAASGVKQAQEHLRLAELRLKAGTGTRAELLQVRAQLANAQGSLTQARNGANLARLNLSNAVNAPVGDRPLTDPTVPSLSVSLTKDLVPSLERRTEVRQAATKQKIDETRVSLESRALYPNLQATSRYSQRGLNQGQFSAGMALNWAVFDGFKARNKMDSARAAAVTDQIQLEQTRQRVALEIRQQYQNRDEAKSRVTTSREGLASAQEAYRLGLKRYQVGLSTPFELTDVQTTLIQSGNNYVQAVNDLRASEIRLARAMGYDIASFLGLTPTPMNVDEPEASAASES